MRIRNIKDAHLKINKAKNIIGVDDLKTKLDPKKFNALEIGSGKGGFIYQKASTSPGINYFGIEKNATVILKMINKSERLEQLTNLFIIHGDFALIDHEFLNACFDQIYLNFSDPWPKKRHAKKTVSWSSFLKQISKNLKSRWHNRIQDR